MWHLHNLAGLPSPALFLPKIWIAARFTKNVQLVQLAVLKTLIHKNQLHYIRPSVN